MNVKINVVLASSAQRTSRATQIRIWLDLPQYPPALCSLHNQQVTSMEASQRERQSRCCFTPASSSALSAQLRGLREGLDFPVSGRPLASLRRSCLPCLPAQHLQVYLFARALPLPSTTRRIMRASFIHPAAGHLLATDLSPPSGILFR